MLFIYIFTQVKIQIFFVKLKNLLQSIKKY